MMLVLEDVYSNYGAASILRGVSLHVSGGEAVGLLGRNGMGKTTLVRTVLGLSPPSLLTGHLSLDKASIGGLPPYRIAHLGIGLVPQGRHIFGSLTVLENLAVAEKPPGDGAEAWTIKRVCDLFPRLRERLESRGRNLSGGEQQMLAIGRALMTNPRMLLMDEPSEGLAPIVIGVIRDHLQKLKESGLSIFLVEQNLGLALAVCDRIYILGDGGLIVWEGSAAELDADDQVKEEHLGV